MSTPQPEPARLTIYLLAPGGYRCVIELHALSVYELLKKAEEALSWAQRMGYTPETEGR